MARKIIYRRDGLNNQSPVPNGYKYVGYDSDTFSEKDGNTIFPIGGGGGGSTEILIEITRADLTNAISNNELVPGATYKITGVHKDHTVFMRQFPALYDDGRGLGTTIFLKAVSENKLESYGSGLFYNPKGLNTKGIWTNKVNVKLSNISGNFYLSSETVTTTNNAKGKILTKGWIEFISGDWVNATSLSGDDSGATADIDSVSIPSYNVDDVVLWGGYAWKNLNGNIGSSIDVLNLDTEWEKIDYTDSTYYNEVVDYIEYDIENDLITRRRNEEYNIDVNATSNYSVIANLQFSFEYSPISVMNYGMEFVIWSYIDDWGEVITVTYGINGVKVNNSYAELVNFEGGMISNVNFDNGSSFYSVNFDRGSFNNVNFDNGSDFNNVNFDNGSGFSNVNFDSSYFYNVNFDSSGFNNVNFDNGSGFNNVNFSNYNSFYNVNFDNGSDFNNVNFDNGSGFNNVNLDNGSSFYNVNLDNGRFNYVNFDAFGISYTNPTILLDNKSISNADFKGYVYHTIGGTNHPLPDLSSATVIFDPTKRKEVIKIQGATHSKLITYDISGNRVVNDIDD